MDNLGYVNVFGLALALSLMLVPVAKTIALRFGIMDKPDMKLKKHKTPVPYLGGAAVFLAFFAALFIERMLDAGTLKGLTGLILGSSMMFLLGLADDIKKLSVPFKFSVQVLAALTLVIFGIKIEFLGNSALNVLFTILWMVGVTNAFNLMDIMDGLAGGVALAACMMFFVLGSEGGKLFSPFASLALAGSILGFLFYNKPPAKIFMGDAGSLFIGFMLAALSVTESYSYTNSYAVFAPVVILGLPVFDTLFVMWMRWKLGKPVYYGSPDHFPLRLRRHGLSVKQVLLIAYSMAIVLASIGYLLTKVAPFQSLLIYGFLAGTALFFAKKLSKIG